MALLRCSHCRYLFEAKQDICPACGRKVTDDDGGADERRKTRKFPSVKLPPPDDGTKKVNGVECKQAPEPQRNFRSFWIKP